MTNDKSVKPEFLVPDWSAPSAVKSLVTTRAGGASTSPFDHFNLATHVEDNMTDVQRNRSLLQAEAGLPAEPIWLQQVHGIQVVRAELAEQEHIADASTTAEADVVCTIMTADCLPVLFCNQSGTQVAAAHAGWRGLANGILETTRNTFECESVDIMAWLGPAIGPQAFEVGDDVRDIYLDADPALAAVFAPGKPGKWVLDIYAAARLRLAALGITNVSGGEYCTYTDQARFYSYRRDGQTGRMASLIWIDGNL